MNKQYNKSGQHNYYSKHLEHEQTAKEIESKMKQLQKQEAELMEKLKNKMSKKERMDNTLKNLTKFGKIEIKE